MESRRIILTGVAVVAMMGGVWSLFGPRPPSQHAADCGISGVTGASIGGPFTLTRHDGTRVDQSILQGAPSLIYFGFTFCPDICPTSLSAMADATDMLDEQGVTANNFLITIDPERDTPEVLSDYVSHFHPRTEGLTGSPEDVAAAAKAWRVYYARAEDESLPGGYAMDHSGFIYLHDAAGDLVTFFRHGTPPEEMARVTACYFGAA